MHLHFPLRFGECVTLFTVRMSPDLVQSIVSIVWG